jgi:hypothetical protein
MNGVHAGQLRAMRARYILGDLKNDMMSLLISGTKKRPPCKRVAGRSISKTTLCRFWF